MLQVSSTESHCAAETDTDPEILGIFTECIRLKILWQQATIYHERFYYCIPLPHSKKVVEGSLISEFVGNNST